MKALRSQARTTAQKNFINELLEPHKKASLLDTLNYVNQVRAEGEGPMHPQNRIRDLDFDGLMIIVARDEALQ